MGSNNWFAGAVVGFTTAFLIQALAGHWKLWVDGRKSAVDDLIKAIDAAKIASVAYFDQDKRDAGPGHAKDVIYAQKLTTDLFGLVDKRFGPTPDSVNAAFRAFREITTGDGFLQAGECEKERCATIAIHAAAATNALRDWSLGQLSFIQTGKSWVGRKRRDMPIPHIPHEKLFRLTR